MISREIVRRLRAFHGGRPTPKGETKHFAIVGDPDILVVAFLRMGGESRPWGIAFGHPDSEPRVLWVPEGRNRDLVADMCAEFAPVLLEHFRTPRYVMPEPTQWEELAPLRQLWLPNPSHLEMLHHLAYAYTFTKWGAGPRGRLNAFGRLCGWLQRESQRPGQQHTIVATDALRESYAFPAQDVRQGHLGFLLAWLDDEGDRDSRHAAATEAEHVAVSTSLDPWIERSETEPLVEAWLTARNSENAPRMKEASGSLGEVLERELRHRWYLTMKAIEILRADERRINFGVQTLITEGLKEQWYQHTRQELNIADDDDGPAFVASPETDRYPAAAGSRYQVHLSSADLCESVLLHDDTEMQAEAIANGDGFRGTIVDVYDIGEGRRSEPVWIVEDPIGGQLRLREGAWVCVAGLPARTGIIETIEEMPGGGRRFEVWITGWKTKPDQANEPAHVGRTVVFVTNSAHQISRLKSQRIWSADTPGAWLTHARPSGPRTRLEQDLAEDVESIRPVVPGV